MSLRLGALYDALLTAQGVSPEDAKKAAEEVAGYDKALADIRTDLKVLQALSGITITLVLGLLGLVLQQGQRLAAIAATVGVP